MKGGLAISGAKRINRDTLVGTFTLETGAGSLPALLFERDGKRSVVFPPGRHGGYPTCAITAADLGSGFARSVLGLAEAALGVVALPAP